MYYKIKEDTENFRLHEIYKEVHNFCNIDLSAFYFDIRKDTLYCSSFDSIERRSCRTVMDVLFKSIATWLAPILCFTSEEAWQQRFQDESSSVHLQEYYAVEQLWDNTGLANKWNRIRDLRLKVNNTLEEKRKNGEIGSSLEAKINLEVSSNLYEIIKDANLSEIFICSKVVLNLNSKLKDDVVEVFCEKAIGIKCERCWKVSEEVRANKKLCKRCEGVINKNKI